MVITAEGTSALRRSATASLTRGVAAVASIVSLIPLPSVQHLTGAMIVLLLLLPILVSFSRSQRWLLAFVGGAALVAILAPLCALLAGATAGGVPEWEWLARPVGLAVSTLVLVWSASQIGVAATVVLAIPAPMIFDLVSRSGQGNDWKYAISVWVTIGTLVAVHRLPVAWKLSAVGIIIAVSALNDTRGVIAMVGVGAAVEFLNKTGRTRFYKITSSVVGSIALAIATFQLAVVGAFGAKIQNTMLTQTQTGPMSLLRVARPESGGNVALISSDPFRLIISDVVTSDQAAIIRDSFTQVNRDPNSLYVNGNVLNSAEMHSIATDMWLHMGFLGLLFAVLCAVFFVFLALKAFQTRSTLTTVAVFVSFRGIWDLMFSPMSDIRAWPLYLAVGLIYTLQREAINGGPR